MQFDDGILYEHNKEAYKKLMTELDNKNESFAYVAPTNVILDKFLDIIIDNLFNDKKESLNKCKTIEQRVKKVEKVLGSDIHLLTYAGINENIKRGKIDLKVNRIVLDEFHHCGADIWGSSVEEFLKLNSEAKVLGLSATPIRMDGKNMVEEMFDGKVASEITLKQLHISFNR